MSSNEHLRFYPNQIRLFFDPRIVFKKKLTNFFFFRSSFVSFRFDTSAGDVKETNGICSYFLRMANPILFLFLECPHPKRERESNSPSQVHRHTHTVFFLIQNAFHLLQSLESFVSSFVTLTSQRGRSIPHIVLIFLFFFSNNIITITAFIIV